MVNAVVSLVVGTMVAVTYWFALASPMAAIMDALNTACLPSITAGGAQALAAYGVVMSVNTNVLGIWIISTLISYVILFFMEANRSEDVYTQEGVLA